MQWEEYNYWIANIGQIGNRKIETLLGYFGSAKEIFHLPEEDLKRWVKTMESYGRGRITEGDIDRIVGSRDSNRIQREYQSMVKKGIRFITIESTLYPPKLKAIYDAPYALYVKGSIPGEEENPHNKYLAVIGARECTSYGREMAELFARKIAAMGMPIISGLARGIDTYAHQGAIQGEGITYAVLGCGVDICYPKENIHLYMEILERQGGIISEFPPGSKPYPNNFPMRNRIISGLSDGILVIEAKEKSGSLITVDMGLDQGKEIYAIPGKILDRCSMGCNNLIRMGAKLVTSSEDILEDLIDSYHQLRKTEKQSIIDNTTCNVERVKEKQNKEAQNKETQNNEILNEIQNNETQNVKHKENNNLKSINTHSNSDMDRYASIIMSHMDFEPKHLELLMTITKLPLDILLEQLLFLELKGYIRQTTKNYYILKS